MPGDGTGEPDDPMQGIPQEGDLRRRERMSLDPTLARNIQSIARLRHAEWSRRADTQPRGRPDDIGRVAGKLARAYYRGRVTGAAASHELLSLCAGNLIYAMDCYGLNFEAVCDLSEFRVAQVISGLSPDITLPHGPRRQAAKTKLIAATLDCQIVRLAELYCSAKRVRDAYSREQLEQHADCLKQWADDAEDLLDGLTKLWASKDRSILGVLEQTRELILWVGGGWARPEPVVEAEPVVLVAEEWRDDPGVNPPLNHAMGA